MSLRLLKFLFGVYRFLGITPPSIDFKEISVWQKMYSVFTIIAVFCGVAVSVKPRDFYRALIHIKAAVCILIDIGLILFQLYVVLAPNFLKTSHWRMLIKQIKSMRINFPLNQSTKIKFPFYMGFVTAQLYYIFVMIYMVCTWSSVTIFNYMEGYGIILLQFYFVYLYNFLLCSILNIILSNYKHVSVILLNNLEQMKRGRFKEKEFRDGMKHVQSVVYHLKLVVNNFNDIFGWAVALIVVLFGLQLLNYLHYMFMTSDAFEPSFVWRIVLSDLSNLSLNMVSTMSMILMCDSLPKEAENIINISLHMRCFVEEKEHKNMLKHFTNFAENNFPTITAANFFVITRSTLLDVLGIVVSSFIVMIQFETNK